MYSEFLPSARSIPSLDGLRAFAVATVILGHTQSRLLDHARLEPIRMGALGVTCFFVISGFLITGLLIKDTETRGNVDLRRFYIRRAFRIFPAFYVYLLVVALLRVFAHSVSLLTPLT